MKAARQQAITDLLITHKNLTTEALSLQLNVSKETIRRDLNELQMQGKVLRNHGRARIIHQENQDSGEPFHIRRKSHYAHKACQHKALLSSQHNSHASCTLSLHFAQHRTAILCW